MTYGPGPSTPDQNVYHARTHFREKKGIFQWEARIREIKKRGHFADIRPRNFEKG